MQRVNWLPSRGRNCHFDPRLVVVATFCAIAVCKTTTALPGLLIFQLLLAIAALASGVRVGSLLLRGLLVLPFTLAALPLLFTIEGRPLFQLLGWQASWEGTSRYLLILAHCWLCYQAMLLGAAATGPFKFIQALGRMGLPRRLVEILELALRYLDLLLEEANRMRRAQSLRGEVKNLPLGERMGYTSQMLGTLFLRTLDRADRVRQAMKCRGLGRSSLQSELPAMTGGALTATAFLLAGTAGYLLHA